MKTVTFNLYSFSELDRDVQIKLVEKNREKIISNANGYLQGYSHRFLKEFITEVFGEPNNVLQYGYDIRLDQSNFIFVSECVPETFDYVHVNKVLNKYLESIYHTGIRSKYYNYEMYSKSELVVCLYSFLTDVMEDVNVWMMRLKYDTNFVVNYLRRYIPTTHMDPKYLFPDYDKCCYTKDGEYMEITEDK